MTSPSDPFFPANDDNEFYFREGCYILELLNSEDYADCSIARARVLPGQETALHYLVDTVERYVILQGEGVVSVGEKRRCVRAFDTLVIDAGVTQKIANTGQQDLLFLVVCTPRFEVDNYRQIETPPSS